MATFWKTQAVVAKKRAKVKPVPAGYPAVTAYLACGDAAAAIDFYKKAFGAKELMRMPGPGGKIGHMDFLGPLKRGGSAVIERAVAAGAQLVQPVQDKFYGDRTGTVKDPFGHIWHVATHVEACRRAS